MIISCTIKTVSEVVWTTRLQRVLHLSTSIPDAQDIPRMPFASRTSTEKYASIFGTFG